MCSIIKKTGLASRAHQDIKVTQTDMFTTRSIQHFKLWRIKNSWDDQNACKNTLYPYARARTYATYRSILLVDISSGQNGASL